MDNLEEMASLDSELEEVIIPEEDNREDDDQLDDVVPCSYVPVDSTQGVAYDIMDTSNDGFYDEEGYIPSTDTSQMVDIAPPMERSNDGLEEVIIPEEDNRPDDDQLDDVV